LSSTMFGDGMFVSLFSDTGNTMPSFVVQLKDLRTSGLRWTGGSEGGAGRTYCIYQYFILIYKLTSLSWSRVTS